MFVVADTTPLNYLILIGRIDILAKLFTRVLIPDGVITELRHPEAPAVVRDWAKNPPSEWFEIRKASSLEAAIDFLGVGERGAIALTLEANADALLIDERAGRREAARRGLRVIGTLAVLDEAADRGLLDFEAALESLRQTNFRLSPAVLRALTRARGSED